MMNTRETLIEILNKKVHDDWFTNEEIADYLIANGVTVKTAKVKPDKMPVKKSITQDTLSALAALGRKAHGEV